MLGLFCLDVIHRPGVDGDQHLDTVKVAIRDGQPPERRFQITAGYSERREPVCHRTGVVTSFSRNRGDLVENCRVGYRSLSTALGSGSGEKRQPDQILTEAVVQIEREASLLVG